MGLGKNILTLAVLTACSSVALAQTKPNNPALPEDVQISSPRWNHGGNSNGNSNQANSLAGVDELVTQTVTAVPQARADAVVAKWTYRQIGHSLNLASTFLLRDFRESEEYDAAFSAFQDAYNTYDAARNKALEGVRSDERYRAALSLRQSVSGQIAEEHEQEDPDGERLVSLAGLKLDTISSFRDQERDILAADENVVAARRDLVAAGKNLAKVERDFARQARNNETLAELRKNREEARITMLASAAYLDEARTARSIALRYAYVARGYDRYIPRLTDSGYGYGYGYRGYGYGYRGVGIATPISFPVVTTTFR